MNLEVLLMKKNKYLQYIYIKIHIGYLSVDSPDNAGYIYSIIISDDIQTTQTLIAQLVIHDNYLLDV